MMNEITDTGVVSYDTHLAWLPLLGRHECIEEVMDGEGTLVYRHTFTADRLAMISYPMTGATPPRFSIWASPPTPSRKKRRHRLRTQSTCPHYRLRTQKGHKTYHGNDSYRAYLAGH